MINLSIKDQPYPMSRKINAFEQKICICENPYEERFHKPFQRMEFVKVKRELLCAVASKTTL